MRDENLAKSRFVDIKDRLTMENTADIPALPLSAKGVEKFLAGRNVEGIGPVFARQLVDRFGTEAIRILRDDPEKATDISGLGEARARTASLSLNNLRFPAELLAFLASCGVSEIFISRILSKYGKKTIPVILNDPYSMIGEVWQLSFFTADKIGHALRIAKEDPRRLVGALLTAVKHYAEEGHLFATPEEAVSRAALMTGAEKASIEKAIPIALESKRLILSRGGLYLPVFYNAEKQGAEKINLLSQTKMPEMKPENIPAMTVDGHPFSAGQKEAIAKALSSTVMVLTGGPGTGKTTALKVLIEELKARGRKVTLAAPTGRAAKRMAALTGERTSTIHSLLGYRPGEGYHRRMLDTDTLIIDEGSMMEQVLLHHLLDALRPGSQLIIVGDPDQLPAIGAGDVLRDLILSGKIPVAHLDENFRQSQGSLIDAGARSINAGKIPESDYSGDFIIIPEKPSEIHDRIIELVADELPAKKGIDPMKIQVVTPQQIGPLGARQLNRDLQQRLNPEGPALQRGATTLRLGDPVMQTANSSARGVYNGEIGRITSVNTEKQTLEVTFTDGRTSEYQRSELTELVLAYATTVHKLQGSEAPYVIIPVTMAHKPMLYRNLLYTAVSRASRLCLLVGETEALEYAIANTPSASRHSNFRHRLH